jgi:hypothetical protein
MEREFIFNPFEYIPNEIPKRILGTLHYERTCEEEP